MEDTKKATQEAAGTMENYDANIVQNFGTGKHVPENVTQDIFEATKGNKSRTPFMAVINGKAAKERGALDFPPKSEDLKEVFHHHPCCCYACHRGRGYRQRSRKQHRQPS